MIDRWHFLLILAIAYVFIASQSNAQLPPHADSTMETYLKQLDAFIASIAPPSK